MLLFAALWKSAKYIKRIPGIIMYDILDVIKNIDDLYENNTSLAVLKDFERVLDELDMYVYDNWEDGELAYGPQVDRHWITAAFMWPREKMPDPVAGKRLTEIGCRVKFERTHVIEPRKIRSPADFRPGTKKGKLDRRPVWVVEIQMPKKIAFDIYKGYMDKMRGDSEQVEGQGSPTQSALPQAAPAPVAPMAGGVPQAAGGAAAAAGAAPTPAV
jgi:hypothetical protein